MYFVFMYSFMVLFIVRIARPKRVVRPTDGLKTQLLLALVPRMCVLYCSEVGPVEGHTQPGSNSPIRPVTGPHLFYFSVPESEGCYVGMLASEGSCRGTPSAWCLGASLTLLVLGRRG